MDKTDHAITQVLIFNFKTFSILKRPKWVNVTERSKIPNSNQMLNIVIYKYKMIHKMRNGICVDIAQNFLCCQT